MWRQMLSGCLTGPEVNGEQGRLPCLSSSFGGGEAVGVIWRHGGSAAV